MSGLGMEWIAQTIVSGLSLFTALFVEIHLKLATEIVNIKKGINPMSDKKRPPLGIMPEKIFEENKNAERLYNLFQACRRYAEINKVIPCKWIEEIQRRTGRTILFIDSIDALQKETIGDCKPE